MCCIVSFIIMILSVFCIPNIKRSTNSISTIHLIFSEILRYPLAYKLKDFSTYPHIHSSAKHGWQANNLNCHFGGSLGQRASARCCRFPTLRPPALTGKAAILAAHWDNGHPARCGRLEKRHSCRFPRSPLNFALLEPPFRRPFTTAARQVPEGGRLLEPPFRRPFTTERRAE